MTLIRNGEQLHVTDSYAELRCAYTTVKREVDALKAEGHIEFVGPSKTGHYRLAKTTGRHGVASACTKAVQS